MILPLQAGFHSDGNRSFSDHEVLEDVIAVGDLWFRATRLDTLSYGYILLSFTVKRLSIISAPVAVHLFQRVISPWLETRRAAVRAAA